VYWYSRARHRAFTRFAQMIMWPCTHMVDKEREKIANHQDLRLEIQRMRNITTRVAPIVVGTLGATVNNLEKHIEDILGKKKIPN